MEEILEAVPDELRDTSDNPVNLLSAVESLVHADWVERSEQGKYRFRVDLLRMWIRREHTIWHLADELQRGIDQ